MEDAPQPQEQGSPPPPPPPPPPVAQQPPGPAGPSLGLRIAAGAAVLLLAGIFVAGSWAFLDWWDRRSPDPVDTAASEDPPATARKPDVYAAPGGHFEIDFPKRPQRSVVRLPVGNRSLKTVMFVAEQKERAFVVGMTNVPEGKVSLDGAALGAAAGANAELLSTRKTKHQGYDAVTYTAKSNGNETFVIKGLIVRTPRRMFQANVVARRTPDQQYRDLIDSFRINRDKA